MPASIVGDWQAIAQTEPYVTNELAWDKQVRHDCKDSWGRRLRMRMWTRIVRSIEMYKMLIIVQLIRNNSMGRHWITVCRS